MHYAVRVYCVIYKSYINSYALTYVLICFTSSTFVKYRAISCEVPTYLSFYLLGS